MKYKFIKSRTQIERELNNLWDNEILYKFVFGSDYVKKRELEIMECIPIREQESLRDRARIYWYLKNI
jgi:hypothetical protein